MAAVIILGAVETGPGWMTIDYAFTETPTQIEQMITPIEVYNQYLTCLN